MDEQKLENRLTKLEESLDYIGEDLEDLKSTQADIHSLALSVNTLATQLKRLVDDMCNVESRVVTLEGCAGRKWESMVKTIITAIVAGLVGFGISKFMGG